MKKTIFALFILSLLAGCGKEEVETQKPDPAAKTLEQRVFEYGKNLKFQTVTWPANFVSVTRQGLSLEENEVAKLEKAQTGQFQLQKYPSGETLTATIGSTVWVFSTGSTTFVEVQSLSGQSTYTYK